MCNRVVNLLTFYEGSRALRSEIQGQTFEEDYLRLVKFFPEFLGSLQQYSADALFYVYYNKYPDTNPNFAMMNMKKVNERTHHHHPSMAPAK